MRVSFRYLTVVLVVTFGVLTVSAAPAHAGVASFMRQFADAAERFARTVDGDARPYYLSKAAEVRSQRNIIQERTVAGTKTAFAWGWTALDAAYSLLGDAANLGTEREFRPEDSGMTCRSVEVPQWPTPFWFCEFAETEPQPSGPTGRAAVEWNVQGFRYKAVIELDGRAGMADVRYQSAQTGQSVDVRQDLQLRESSGTLFYVGSNARYLTTGQSHPTYRPDTFRLVENSNGNVYFDRVCDTGGVCAPVTYDYLGD